VAEAGEAVDASGSSLAVKEWAHGPNPGPSLHVHHSDDEAWHVIEGVLRFRFADRTFDAGPGSTVFAPAGVAHTYGNPGPGEVRYLIIATPRVFAMIDAQHALESPSRDELAALAREFDSEILE
jgi:mannose-6-phosphate isomerase-like protein (cupin superfamily)